MKIGNVRRALELIYAYGFGFTVITKSNGILRDLELLQKINEKTKCVVQMTLTTYDEDLCMKAKVYGIVCFGMGLTLREGNRGYFYEKLDRLFPQLKEKYIKTYQNRYVPDSPNNDLLRKKEVGVVIQILKTTYVNMAFLSWFYIII